MHRAQSWAMGLATVCSLITARLLARCANRGRDEPDERYVSIGFRFAPAQRGPAEPAGRVSEKPRAEPATLRSGPAGRGGTPPTLREHLRRQFKD